MEFETRRIRPAGHANIISLPKRYLRTLDWRVYDWLAISLEREGLLLQKLQPKKEKRKIKKR